MSNESHQKDTVEHQAKKTFYQRNWLFIVMAILFAVSLAVYASSSTTSTPISAPTQPPPTPVPSPIPIPKEDNVGPKWDYVNLTPEIFNRIIQKIKSAPKAEIKATASGEQSSVTFYYSFVTHDPCEPSLKDFLVFEVETTTYVDENGQKYPNGPITDYYSMRDIDHDNFPEDYFTPGKPNPDAKLCDLLHLPLTKDTPDIDNLLSYWEAGMNYFAANLLK